MLHYRSLNNLTVILQHKFSVPPIKTINLLKYHTEKGENVCIFERHGHINKYENTTVLAAVSVSFKFLWPFQVKVLEVSLPRVWKSNFAKIFCKLYQAKLFCKFGSRQKYFACFSRQRYFASFGRQKYFESFSRQNYFASFGRQNILVSLVDKYF